MLDCKIFQGELRIGNFVIHPNGKNIIKVIKTGGDQNYFNLKPIPLSMEILQKCGFTFSEDTVFGKKKIYGILGDFTFIYNRIMWNSFIIGHIKYLHQLQNLYYALTEQELTVNI